MKKLFVWLAGVSICAAQAVSIGPFATEGWVEERIKESESVTNGLASVPYVDDLVSDLVSDEELGSSVSNIVPSWALVPVPPVTVEVDPAFTNWLATTNVVIDDNVGAFVSNVVPSWALVPVPPVTAEADPIFTAWEGSNLYVRTVHSGPVVLQNTLVVGTASVDQNVTTAVAEGTSKAYANNSHAEGRETRTASNAAFSHVEGQGSKTGGQYSHAAGYRALTAEGGGSGGAVVVNPHDYAWAWNGDYTIGDQAWYASHGPGTFNVNPKGGISNFWIGETNLATYLQNAGGGGGGVTKAYVDSHQWDWGTQVTNSDFVATFSKENQYVLENNNTGSSIDLQAAHNISVDQGHELMVDSSMSFSVQDASIYARGAEYFPGQYMALSPNGLYDEGGNEPYFRKDSDSGNSLTWDSVGNLMLDNGYFQIGGTAYSSSDVYVNGNSLEWPDHSGVIALTNDIPSTNGLATVADTTLQMHRVYTDWVFTQEFEDAVDAIAGHDYNLVIDRWMLYANNEDGSIYEEVGTFGYNDDSNPTAICFLESTEKYYDLYDEFNQKEVAHRQVTAGYCLGTQTNKLLQPAGNYEEYVDAHKWDWVTQVTNAPAFVESEVDPVFTNWLATTNVVQYSSVTGIVEDIIDYIAEDNFVTGVKAAEDEHYIYVCGDEFRVEDFTTVVTNATAGNIAAIDTNGNLIDSGVSTNVYLRRTGGTMAGPLDMANYSIHQVSPFGKEFWIYPGMLYATGGHQLEFTTNGVLKAGTVATVEDLAGVVHRTGNETIAGDKTFESSITVQDGGSFTAVGSSDIGSAYETGAEAAMYWYNGITHYPDPSIGGEDIYRFPGTGGGTLASLRHITSTENSFGDVYKPGDLVLGWDHTYSVQYLYMCTNSHTASSEINTNNFKRVTVEEYVKYKVENSDIVINNITNTEFTIEYTHPSEFFTYSNAVGQTDILLGTIEHAFDNGSLDVYPGSVGANVDGEAEIIKHNIYLPESVLTFDSIAPMFTTNNVYTNGDFVIRNRHLYECTNATSGAWVQGNWKQTSVTEILGNLRKILDEINGEAL